jgi:hypothetical protein
MVRRIVMNQPLSIGVDQQLLVRVASRSLEAARPFGGGPAVDSIRLS